MNVTEHQILELIRQGEGIATEFKTCRNQINRDGYKTVCAFLNRHGGTLLLGVKDSGKVQGIALDARKVRRYIAAMDVFTIVTKTVILTSPITPGGWPTCITASRPPIPKTRYTHLPG
jgi:hypothetical protein